MSQINSSIGQVRFPEGFIPGAPLPSAIAVDSIEAISESAKRKIKLFSGPRPWRFLGELALVWISIFASIIFAAWLNNWLASVLIIAFIATRQNLLALLVHEQVHYLCSRSRWADAITNLFAAWPLVALSIEGYAKVHLAHHSYFFTEKDPDFFRKNGKEWSFPMKVKFLCWLFFKDVSGGSFMALLAGKRSSSADSIRRPAPLPSWLKPIYYLSIAALAIQFGIGKLVLLYWIIPLITFFPMIVRFGAICEHKYNVSSGKLEESTAIIILKWWEKILLPNLNFNYHIYHHYYPAVSFSRLPDVHQVFLDENLVNQTAIFRGYSSYIRHLMGEQSLPVVSPPSA